MDDTRLPKKILFGELAIGKRPQHKPKLRWRDCIAKDLHSFQIPSDWQNLALSRVMWHTMLLYGSVSLDTALDDKAKFLRACRKGKPFLPCSVCAICTSLSQVTASHKMAAASHSEKGIKIHMTHIHHKQYN